MNTTADIWISFARMFGMLFVVLSMILLGFYLVKRFSVKRRAGQHNLIEILGIHHLSPKEKLVLVKAVDQVLLIGVTPNAISTLSSVDPDSVESLKDSPSPRSFSDFMAEKLTSSGIKSFSSQSPEQKAK